MISNRSTIILVLAILVAANYLVSLLPVIRLDLSDSQSYTLSSVTREKLKNLDDIVNIKVYASENLPAKLIPLKQQLRDLLHEYSATSRGKIRVKYLDPKDDPVLKHEAQNQGIPELRFSDLEKDKFSVSTGFFGLVFLYAARSEAIPAIVEGSDLEYRLTSALAKVVQKEPVKIVFTTGHGESAGFARQILEREYAVSDLNLKSEDAKIDDKIKTLLILGPKEKFGDKEKEILKNFLARDGSILVAVDGVNVNDNLSVQPAEHALFDFLAGYGLKLNRDLVFSTSSEVANFTSGQDLFFTQYPLWVKVNHFGFNKEIPAVSRLETALFPWVSSLEISGAAVPLVKTVKESWRETANFNLDPVKIQSPPESELREIALAGMSKGRGKLVLVANSRFVEDNFLSRFKPNAALFLNLVEFISGDSRIFEIRSRAAIFRPLRNLNEREKEIVRDLNLLTAPLVLALIGGVKIWRRTKV